MSDTLPRKTPPQWRKQQRLAHKTRRRAKSDAWVPAIPIHQRLGFGPAEFAALVGVSYVTVWPGIKAGKIPFVEQNGTKIIPRSYAVKVGYITE